MGRVYILAVLDRLQLTANYVLPKHNFSASLPPHSIGTGLDWPLLRRGLTSAHDDGLGS